MNRIVPVIGSVGTFVMSPPFDQLINPKERLVVKGSRAISELLASSENPYELYYKTRNIDENIYNAHVEQDVEIISLMSDKGVWFNVPSPYIVSYPSVNGVPYQARTITVVLPAITTARDLNSLMSTMKEQVMAELGVDCVVREVLASKIIFVTTEKHEMTEIERLAKTSQEKNNVLELAKYKKIIDDQRLYIQQLEAMIP